MFSGVQITDNKQNLKGYQLIYADDYAGVDELVHKTTQKIKALSKQKFMLHIPETEEDGKKFKKLIKEPHKKEKLDEYTLFCFNHYQTNYFSIQFEDIDLTVYINIPT